MNFSKLNIRKNLLLAIIVMVSTGCEKFLDVNTDLDQPSESTPNFLLPPILGLMAVNCYEQGETTGYFAQHVAILMWQEMRKTLLKQQKKKALKTMKG